MCLVTTQLEPIILEEDMEVFKVLRDDLNAIYQDFQYEYGKLYETEIKDENDSDDFGWSCCDSLDQKYLETNHPDWQEEPKHLRCLARGFHSAKSSTRIECLSSFQGDDIMVKCIIPKGSEVFYEPTGLVISNKIIIKEKI